jgi:hypothetical protein
MSVFTNKASECDFDEKEVMSFVTENLLSTC